MTILEQYKYVSVVGEGYFSFVKQYQNRNTGELFAVKELKKDFAKNTDYIHRFRREIDLLKTLSGCENIIELIDYQIDENANLYIMPLATTNLYDYVKRNNANLSSEQRIALFDQVLNAIKFSHSKRVLHRDIYPRNVLLFARHNGFLEPIRKML